MRRALPPLLVLLFAGCGSGGLSGGGDGGSPGADLSAVTAEQACAEAAAAYCKLIDSCLPFAIIGAYGDVATCATRAVIGCRTSRLAKGAKTTPAQLLGCAQVIGKAACLDALAGKLPPECGPFPGSVDNGGACGDGGQCQSNFCNKAGGQSCGACAAAPKEGEVCQNGGCGNGLTCAAGKCVRRGAAGAACDGARPCEIGLACFGGTCRAPLDAGATCDPMDKATPPCNALRGLYCNGATRTCKTVGVAGPGEACGVVGLDYIACRAGGRCKPTGGLSGTCVAPAADGGQCSEDRSGAPCLEPARCLNGVCKIQDPSTCS